jgi:hypothetical protein
MPNTLNLLEQVRARVPKHTDYAVAKALEMDQSHLAKVLCGKAGLGPIPVVRVSEILQRDLKDVLVLIEEDKAKTRKQREFWERRSPRITAAILTTILAVAAGFQQGLTHYMETNPLDAHPVGTSPFYTLCVVAILTIRKINEWLRGPQLQAA